MPETGAAFEITYATTPKALAADLARVPVVARTLIAARMEGVARQMQARVQRNAAAIPVHGDTATGLRQSIGRATKAHVTVTRAGITATVAVDPAAMPAGQEKLPALMEGPGWKHPVFGSPDAAVFQPGHAYFKPAVDPLLPAMGAAQAAGMAEATRNL
jgi:hypothetical protein